ncbi:peroxisomal biogenesis factor 11 [Aspergillus aurantiobrunneus]
MAQRSPTQSGASPLKQLVVFTKQTAGLEKTLRFIQAVSQVVGVTSDDKFLATQCLTARDQLALGRRYFRLLEFYGCFERVHGLLTSTSSTGTLLYVMELAQYTFLGLYFLLENFTILHDMNVARVDWYRPLMTEANKFWLYALTLSIIRATWEVLFPVEAPAGGENGTEKNTKQPAAPKWPLVKRIIIDGCDLTLPGSFIGWVPATGLQIGLVMVVSTVLAGHNVWLAQG